MILDSRLQLSAEQAFSTDAYTENVIDLGSSSPSRGIGDGEPMALVINVTSAGTGGGVYEFHFVQSDNANLSSDDELVTRVIAESALSAGSIHVIPVPPGAVTKRYVGGKFDNVSGSTAVSADVFLMPQSFVQRYKDYADGVIIS